MMKIMKYPNIKNHEIYLALYIASNVGKPKNKPPMFDWLVLSNLFMVSWGDGVL